MINYTNKYLSNAPATTIAYVIKGFFAYTQRYDLCTTDLMGNAGECELVRALIDLAGCIEEEFQTYNQRHDSEFPGVWDYEISEPFGAALANYVHLYGKLPNMAAAKDLVRCRVNEATNAMHKEVEPSLKQVVWVIVAKDQNGQPRGFEKTWNERFYLTEDDAHAAHRDMNELGVFFTVAEARIGYAKEQQ